MAAIAALVAGCDVSLGDEEEATTVTEPATTVTERTVQERRQRSSTESEAESSQPATPSGALGTSGVGPVTVGVSQDEVEQVFGAPDRKQTVNFGGGEAPQIDWIWDYDDGELRLQFETGGNTLTGYQADTAQLATSSGYTVGSPFEPIAEEYGDQLEEAAIGEGLYLLSEDAPGTYPALTFAVRGGTITSIGGGEPQAAGD